MKEIFKLEFDEICEHKFEYKFEHKESVMSHLGGFAVFNVAKVVISKNKLHSDTVDVFLYNSNDEFVAFDVCYSISSISLVDYKSYFVFKIVNL